MNFAKKTRQIITITLFFIIALTNIFIIINARRRYGFNNLSAITLILSLLHLGIVLGGFAVKNKRNIFSFWRYGSTIIRRLENLEFNPTDTSTIKYKTEFFIYSLAWTLPLPFYLPLIITPLNLENAVKHLLLSFLVFFSSVILMIFLGLCEIIKGNKEANKQSKQEEQERIEQERLEEQGYWRRNNSSK